MEKVILVHVEFEDARTNEDALELSQLASSAGAQCVDFIKAKRCAPHAKYFIGQGKLEALCEAVHLHQADLVIFNHSLTPSQERNLEQRLQCRVLDRMGLILDIFAQRALTHEAKLQVELAQLQYASTRLVRGWTHLERQKGGIGLRGPGESQLETDRRLIRIRMKTLSKRIEKIKQQRSQNRRARIRGQHLTVALVGYTNAGKTALFNALTQARALSVDQLFATLDPTLRRLDLNSGHEVILADTVGFLRHLPHGLVDAFKATLEEVHEADLLLHVVDVNSLDREDNQAQVNHVLKAIQADCIPTLMVFNKIDCSADPEPRVVNQPHSGLPQAVFVSALYGQGLDQLKSAIVSRLFGKLGLYSVVLDPAQGALRAYLHQKKTVCSEQVDDQGRFHLTCLLSDTMLNTLGLGSIKP